MATIDIKLSTTAFAHQPAGSLGAIVDGIERVTYASAAQYQAPTSWSLSGTNLVYTYADGTTETYTGFVKDNPAAVQGTAIATGDRVLLKDQVALSYSGIINLHYAMNGGMLEVESADKGFLINDVGFALQLPVSSPYYDTVNGNAAMAVKGALTFLPSGELTGMLSQLSLTSQKILLSQTIDGNFHVTGNVLTDGTETTHSTVSGVLTGYHEAYADGSHVDVSGVAAQLAAPAVVNANLLANPAYFGGSDTINIDLPATLASDYLMAAGAGDDRITLKGGGGRLNLDAGEGNDQVTLLGDAHKVDGGKGLDTVFLQAARADVQLVHGSAVDSFTITDKLGAASTLAGVERIQFSDATLALDLEGTAGQAYRLYQAAFARTPDKGGLGFWIGVMDSGTSLNTVAQGFTGTAEYLAAYGANTSSHDLVAKFYENILHRAPEEAGLTFWVNVLDNKLASVGEVLAGISESAENKAGLIGVIGNGFEYTPYHG